MLQNALRYLGLARGSAPLGLKWRSSVWFVTLVVGAGVTTDVFFYTLIIPVIPFRLESLGFSHPSSFTGYLLLAYAAGLVISTPPITWLSEHFHSRRTLLLIGLLSFVGAQVLFMLAPIYGALVVSRVIQGISSTIVWTVGSALLTDTVPEERIGQQFGFALTGLSLGSALGPTIGGALYNSLGFHAPFIAGLILLAFDLMLRFLVIERKDAVKWGFDPAAAYLQTIRKKTSEEQTNDASQIVEIPADLEAKDKHDDRNESNTNDEIDEKLPSRSSVIPEVETPKQHGAFRVIWIILNSRRTMAAALTVFVYGFCIGMLEPTIPLRFQDVYGFTSLKVGLVFMGATLPTIISSAAAGMLCDKYGTGSIIAVCYLLLIPWFLIMAIRGPLALFIVALILLFFFCGTIPAPAMAELAEVATKDMKGVGFAHLYGVFNLAYGVGTCLGPIVGSQLYDHVRDGFTVVQGLATLLLLVAMCVAMAWIGDKPLLVNIRSKFRRPSSDPSTAKDANSM